MGVEVKQSELGAVLSSIPELLMKAHSLGQTNQANEQAAQMNAMKMQQSALELDEWKKTTGRDAASYGNLEIAKYFEDLAYGPGKINTSGGTLTWTGTDAFPTIHEAMAEFNRLATKGGKELTESDKRIFHGQWNEIVGIRNRQFQGAIKTLQRQKYSQEDIEYMLSQNPILDQSISNIMGHVDDESSTFYAGFQPQRQVGLGTRIAESPLTTVGVGVGTAVAGQGLYNLSQATPQSTIEDAQRIFKGQRRELNNNVKLAQDKLDAIKAKKRYKGKANDIRSAESILEEAKSKRITGKKEASESMRKMVKEDNYWKKLKGSKKYSAVKHMGTLRGFVPTLFATGAGTVGGFLGGEQGEAVGRATGATAGMVAGGMPLGQYVAKRVMAKMPAMAARFGLAAMADSPAIPIGDVIGALMAAGMGISEISAAVKDWNKANR
jgi:hypothetical protein